MFTALSKSGANSDSVYRNIGWRRVRGHHPGPAPLLDVDSFFNRSQKSQHRFGVYQRVAGYAPISIRKGARMNPSSLVGHRIQDSNGRDVSHLIEGECLRDPKALYRKLTTLSVSESAAWALVCSRFPEAFDGDSNFLPPVFADRSDTPFSMEFLYGFISPWDIQRFNIELRLTDYFYYAKSGRGWVNGITSRESKLLGLLTDFGIMKWRKIPPNGVADETIYRVRRDFGYHITNKWFHFFEIQLHDTGKRKAELATKYMIESALERKRTLDAYWEDRNPFYDTSPIFDDD